MMKPVQGAARIDTKHTVAGLLLGRSSRSEALLFRFTVKNLGSTCVLWLIWFIGLVLGLLSIAHRVPNSKVFIFSSILLLPLPCLSLLVLQVNLLKTLLTSFDCYLIACLQVSVFVYALKLLQDIRIFFWMCYLPSMLVALFMDAYPQKYRRAFELLFSVANCFVWIAWGVMVVLGWCAPLHDDAIIVGKLSGQLTTASIPTVLTLICFNGRHCFKAVFKHQEFTIIRSSMKTLHIDVVATVSEVATMAETGSSKSGINTMFLDPDMSMQNTGISSYSSPLVYSAYSSPSSRELSPSFDVNLRVTDCCADQATIANTTQMTPPEVSLGRQAFSGDMQASGGDSQMPEPPTTVVQPPVGTAPRSLFSSTADLHEARALGLPAELKQQKMSVESIGVTSHPMCPMETRY
jgi:hypothetical protein